MDEELEAAPVVDVEQEPARPRFQVVVVGSMGVRVSCLEPACLWRQRFESPVVLSELTEAAALHSGVHGKFPGRALQ